MRDHEGSSTAGTERASGGAPSRRRRSALDLLVIAALTGLALAQPVLDLFGNSPSTIQFRGVSGSDVVIFAAVLVLVPPLVLWIVAELVGLVDRRAGRAVHIATFLALAGLLGTLLAKELTASTAGAIALATLFAGAATLAYMRLDAVRQWLVLLSGVNLLIVLQFVLLSPAADLITVQEQDLTAASFAPDALDADGDPASVVMVVLDELATQSIIGDDEAIDAVRFPNLAAFSSEATWYRHFSTVSPFTQSAVPALLDGKDPFGEPLQADHPDNLFTLLADSHELIVSEALTRLCGFDACEGSADKASVGSPDVQWRGLLDDAADAWFERLRPGANAGRESYDDFVEELEDVGGDGAGSLAAQEQRSAEAFFATGVDAQPTRLSAFVDALAPSDDPFFAFLHLVMPHQPWLVREDGTTYDIPGEDDREPDVATAWEARVTRQRHLLQAEYTDRLVGLILDRLREVGEYDDSLVVIVSDHGVAFEPGQSTRSVTEENLEQIVYAPLLIKTPGQADGQIDDSNLLSVDVTPTIAAVLGTTPSWDLDGVAAGSPEDRAERADEKYVYNYTDAFTYEFLGVERYSDETRFGQLLDGRFPPVTREDSRLAGLYAGQPGADLIGASASVLRSPDDGPEAGPVEIRELESLQAPPSAELLATVSGAVPDGAPGDMVVIAVNGTIVGVSPLFDNADGTNQFLVLLPAGALDADRNDVRAGVIAAGGTVAERRGTRPLG